MSIFSDSNPSDTYGTCDICGAPLDPEDKTIHLCKICQAMQFEDEQNR